MEEPIADFEISQKVEDFAESIMAKIRELSPDLEIRSTADTAVSNTGEASALRVYIKTDFGVVIVTPDFANRSSAAFAINLGLVRCMSMEGFTDEQIDKESKIYSDMVKFTSTGTEIMAYYLSHKISSSK